MRATREITYDLRCVQHVFDPENGALLADGRTEGGRRFVVVDERVHRFHGTRIEAYFRAHGVQARVLLLQSGEANKTMDALQHVLHALDSFPIHRRDEPVIAIGGGVLTDIVAFAASCYRRGVPHIKVPTTLMGYVDAAVGVKTAVNFNGHKNRLGSFEPPRAVLLDQELLGTLAPRYLRDGMCEIIKLAVICDRELFDLLEQHGARAIATAFQDGQSKRILDAAVGGMLQELSPNLYEEQLARKVDFGHTFSYGLEARFATRLLHGEAVLLDILVSCVIAESRGLLMGDEAERVLALVEQLGIRPAIELLDPALMWHALADRVEHRNGHQHVPLPTAIGNGVFVDDMTLPEIKRAVDTLKKRMSEDERLAKC